jgi:hypothetical protein
MTVAQIIPVGLDGTKRDSTKPMELECHLLSVRGCSDVDISFLANADLIANAENCVASSVVV